MGEGGPGGRREPKFNYNIYLDVQVSYLDIQAIFAQYLMWILNY